MTRVYILTSYKHSKSKRFFLQKKFSRDDYNFPLPQEALPKFWAIDGKSFQEELPGKPMCFHTFFFPEKHVEMFLPLF